MPYVSRNAQGQIESLHRTASATAGEFVDDRHPDVLEFLGSIDDDDTFSQLDAGFVRVIEDLVDVLLAKNILNITDLPAEAQAKLFQRKGFRDRISSNSLQLFDINSSDVI
ncbi:hypothetical protein [Piscinibacter sakaiensis]|uniref:hypothetical protein n=1 Tax=Piscinibacter sakaiensis TaxID=1547922 RepID=UPI003AAEB289